MSDCLRSVKRVRMLPAIRGAVPRGGFDADPAGVRLALPATCHRRLHRRVVHVLRVGDLAPLGARRQRQHNEERGEGPDRVVAAGLRFGVRRREIVVEPGDRRVHVPRWRVFSRMSEISSIWATQRWALEPANPTQLAETVAYLLGNAHRCGVADECVRARRNSDSRLDRCRRSGFC